MYFCIFSSSEYYSDEDIDDEAFINDNELCLICWLPSEETNQVKLLSDFTHIKSQCKCNPKIHSNCFDEWIKKSLSCPICRTKINIVIYTNNTQHIFINYYIFCISYSVYFFRIIYYAFIVNLLVIFFYNICYIYFITNKLYENNHSIY